MARQILQGAQQQQQLAPAPKQAVGAPTSAPLNLRRRSPRYLEVLGVLDEKSGTLGEVDLADAMTAIAEEFAVGEPMPLGLVSVCYLGAPYEVHILDLIGRILEHYKVGQPMPATFEAARRLSLYPSYAYIEVYADHLVCIRADGSVSAVPSS
jgi:hypothetical protein